MKGQTEEIEYGAYNRRVDAVEEGMTYRGYESSIGMSPRRTTDIGRRLLYGAGKDEALAPFFQKPGYTWGVGIRTTPKDWDLHQVRLWPKCAYEPVPKGKASNSVRNSMA